MRISLEDQPIGVAGFRAFGIAVFFSVQRWTWRTPQRSAEMGENVSDMCVRKYRMFQHLESCASQLQ